MIKLSSLLKESNDKVFVQDDYLWVSYSPGSGKTTSLRNPNTFITDKSGDSHFDSNVKDIVKWSETQTPLLKNKISRVHKLPVYEVVGTGKSSREMTVWGGDYQPTKFIYMIVMTETNGVHVIGFHKTKQEAAMWLRQQTRG